MDESYEINEKDVKGVIRFLETHDPENATREKAIELLEDLHAGVHSMAHNNPELLEKLYMELGEVNSKRG